MVGAAGAGDLDREAEALAEAVAEGLLHAPGPPALILPAPVSDQPWTSLEPSPRHLNPEPSYMTRAQYRSLSSSSGGSTCSRASRASSSSIEVEVASKGVGSR